MIAFELAPALEATGPPEARGIARDEVRLLVSDPASDRVEHARFYDLPDYLRAGDLLVVNDSATIPAAVDATSDSGETFPLHFSSPLAGEWWIVEPRTSAPRAQRLRLPGGASANVAVPLLASHARLWLASIDVDKPVLEYLNEVARPIHYRYSAEWPIAAYQTIFGRVPGSVEMPSAGRPFSQRVLAALHEAQIGIATLTLHCGVASAEHDESPAPERFNVPQTTVAKIEATRRHGGRVIAVGTTVVRALESALDGNRRLRAAGGVTDLVIDAGRTITTVDGILTGLHEPRATHLMMLRALAPATHLRTAYAAALDQRYLWHEFGDVHLLLSGSISSDDRGRWRASRDSLPR